MSFLSIMTYLKNIRPKVFIKHGIFSILFLTSIAASSQKTPSHEYRVKAGFLFHFSSFVEWPPTAFANKSDPLIIGVLGKDPFGSYLDEMVKGETINAHPLVVQRFQHVDEIKTCHILFISVSGREEIRKILDTIRLRPVLTVSDAPNFAKNGGIVLFLTDDNKTRILINLEAANEAGLTISSKLLRVSEIINVPNN